MRYILSFFCMLILCLACCVRSSFGQSQPEPRGNIHFSEERERVTAVASSVATPQTVVVPVFAQEGKVSVWRGTVHSDALGLKAISFHATKEISTAAHWELIVRSISNNQLVDSISSDSSRGQVTEFWTRDAPGDTLLLELKVDEAPTRLKLVFDRYSWPREVSRPESIWGKDDMTPILQESENLRSLGNTVARLRIKTNLGEILCTGFLISDSLLMTNRHCISSQIEAANSLADFGYDAFNKQPTTFGVSSLVTGDSSPSMDYAVVRVEGKPGAVFSHINIPLVGKETFAREKVRDGRSKALVIIEHPGGGPKMISRIDCTVFGNDVAGVSEGVITDFQHHCDTLGGSSGSPVFSMQTRQLVGLHHLGADENAGGTLQNQAVYLHQILCDIATHSQFLLPELFGSNSVKIEPACGTLSSH